MARGGKASLCSWSLLSRGREFWLCDLSWEYYEIPFKLLTITCSITLGSSLAHICSEASSHLFGKPLQSPGSIKVIPAYYQHRFCGSYRSLWVDSLAWKMKYHLLQGPLKLRLMNSRSDSNNPLSGLLEHMMNIDTMKQQKGGILGPNLGPKGTMITSESWYGWIVPLQFRISAVIVYPSKIAPFSATGGERMRVTPNSFYLSTHRARTISSIMCHFQ